VIRLLKRTLLALPCFALGYFLLLRAGGGFLRVFALGLLGCACILIGAIILAFPLACLIAEPLGNLFYPGERFNRPLPMYGIPQAKRAKGLYEEAIAGFEKIAEDYPNEVKPYIEMIDIAIRDLKDARRAGAIYHRGIAALKKEEDRANLTRMYGAIQSRLNARPSN